jgi:exosortase
MAQDYNRAPQSNSTKTLQEYSQQATAECARWGDIGIHNYIKMTIIGGLFYYLFRREIYSTVNNWITDPNWSHGFLIPLFSLYFINQRKQDILGDRFKPNYLGLLFLICGVLFYPVNVVQFRFGYLLSITMIATLGAVVLFLGGWRLVKHLWLPVGFLIFAVPLPRTFYVRLTMPMRFIAAKVAAVLLGLVPQVQTTVSGVVIDVIYKGKPVEPALNVAEACSGMRLLMAFVALGVAMAYLHYRPVWHRAVLLAATIPIAIFCNIVRVTVTGFIYVLIGPIYAQGLYHSLLGFVMLPLAFGLYGFIAWFMSSLFVDETELTEDVIVRRR